MSLLQFLFLFFFFFLQSTECLIPNFYPELLSGGVEGQWLQWS